MRSQSSASVIINIHAVPLLTANANICVALKLHRQLMKEMIAIGSEHQSSSPAGAC